MTFKLQLLQGQELTFIVVIGQIHIDSSHFHSIRRMLHLYLNPPSVTHSALELRKIHQSNRKFQFVSNYNLKSLFDFIYTKNYVIWLHCNSFRVFEWAWLSENIICDRFIGPFPLGYIHKNHVSRKGLKMVKNGDTHLMTPADNGQGWKFRWLHLWPLHYW